MTLHYIVSDYYATGEGRTISILITRAYPRTEDYENGNLKDNLKERLIREFAECFDPYLAFNAEVLEKEAFLQRYKNHLSELVIRQLDSLSGNFHYHSQFHINFS